MMGSNDDNDDEKPAHEQCFDEPFWIDRTEVSNEQFERLSGNAQQQSHWSAPLNARDNITWLQARDFCEDQRAMRLPTEREWEYSARGPDALIYPWGNNIIRRNFVEIHNDDDLAYNVGSRPEGKSWVGAMDMSGNMWEWTGSWYAPYEYVLNDGREDFALESDKGTYTERVMRGGSWGIGSADVRGSIRMSIPPNSLEIYLGFRCAKSLE